MSELSRTTGIPRSRLYAALADDANPTMDTITRILDGLRLRLHATADGTKTEAA